MYVLVCPNSTYQSNVAATTPRNRMTTGNATSEQDMTTVLPTNGVRLQIGGSHAGGERIDYIDVAGGDDADA